MTQSPDQADTLGAATGSVPVPSERRQHRGRWKSGRPNNHRAKLVGHSYDIVNELLDAPPVLLSDSVFETQARTLQHEIPGVSSYARGRILLWPTTRLPHWHSRLLLLMLSGLAGAVLAVVALRAGSWLPSEFGRAPQIRGETRLRPLQNSGVAELVAAVSPEEVWDKLPSTLSLSSFVSQWSRWSGLSITIDLDALRLTRATLNTPVVLMRRGDTHAEVLSATLAPLNLSCNMDQGHLVVSCNINERELRRAEHDVSDLLDSTSPQSVERMAVWIQQFVCPESWQAAGGRGLIESNGDVLRVMNSDAVHRDTLIFCELLRRARGIPMVSKVALPETPIEIRRRTAQMMSLPVDIAAEGVAALKDLVPRLEKSCGCTILVNWKALHDCGYSLDSCLVSVAGTNLVLHDVLTNITRQLPLTWRYAGVQCIEITSVKDEESRDMLAWHPIPDDLDANAWIAQHASRLTGGLPQREGVRIQVDEASACIISKLPQSRTALLSAGISP